MATIQPSAPSGAATPARAPRRTESTTPVAPAAPPARPTQQATDANQATTGQRELADAARNAAKRTPTTPPPAPPSAHKPTPGVPGAPSPTGPSNTSGKPSAPTAPADAEGTIDRIGEPKPPVHEQLEAARNHTPPADELRNLPSEDRQAVIDRYRAEQSALYDQVATRLEDEGGPSREDYTINGKFLEWEYRDAQAYYADSLEEAQQGAKPERERALREELAQTPTGREMLEFERRAGVPITVLTDREWRAAGHDPNTLAFSAGDEGLTFNVRHLNSHVYVHEMTHQVDHRTGILAPEGDPRSKEQVIADAQAKYREFGLDPAEVPAVVDATYHQPDLGHSLSHAHTRLAEARHHRLEQGGQPLTADEMREVMALSLPREQDTTWVGRYHDREEADSGYDEGAFRDYARSRGVEVDGRSLDDVAADLQAKAEAAEAQIVEIERRGTTAPGPKSGGGIGGALEGLGGLVGSLGSLKDASLPARAIPMGAGTSATPR